MGTDQIIGPKMQSVSHNGHFLEHISLFETVDMLRITSSTSRGCRFGVVRAIACRMTKRGTRRRRFGDAFLRPNAPAPTWAEASRTAMCGSQEATASSSAAAKVFPIPAFSFQGSDSIPGMILAKQRPKFPTALREPLAKPLLKQDR